MQFRLYLNLFCTPAWLQKSSDPPASASHVQEVHHEPPLQVTLLSSNKKSEYVEVWSGSQLNIMMSINIYYTADHIVGA